MGEWVRQLIEQSGYLGIALLMLLETVFPPIPSELIMPLAGLEAERGNLSLWGAIAAGTTGAMAGNYAWYLLARLVAEDRFRRLVARHGRLFTLRWSEVERGRHWFERFGRAFVLFGRMIPGIRSLVSIPAGLFAMPTLSFLVFSTIGSAVWTAALAGAGYLLGERYELVGTYLNPVSNVVIGVLVAWYLFRVVTWKPGS